RREVRKDTDGTEFSQQEPRVRRNAAGRAVLGIRQRDGGSILRHRGRIETSSARHAVQRGGGTARVRFELGSDLQEGGQDLCARPQGLIRSGGRRLLGSLQLDQSQAERLETNTSMPHMTCATSSGPGEPRVRIPVKRFLACPFNFHRQPRSRGGVVPLRRYGGGAPSAGVALFPQKKRLFSLPFFHVSGPANPTPRAPAKEKYPPPPPIRAQPIPAVLSRRDVIGIAQT